MNITLSGTKVSMDGHTLAFQKNNLVDSMVITVDTDETWQYKLDVKYPCKDSNGKELYNVIDLTRVGNTCTAILQATMLPFNGKYTMQLRGISGNKVYHTDTFDVWVKYSIDPGKVYDPVPSEFYQIEANITSMNNHPPKPGNNGYWLVWNVAKQEYEESDIPLPEGTLPEVSDSTNGWYLTNDGERVYWAEVQGGSGEGDIAAIQVNGIDQPIVDKVAKLTIGKDTVGLGNLDNVRQYSSVNQPPYPVTSVNGEAGAVTLSKADVGLGNVDNTSDANKPISTATQTALNGKLDKTAVVDVTADAIKGQAADAKSVYDVIQALPTGSDLSLGITGATVGQIAKITAVDTNGKPTEWEAVDMARGEDIWEEIATGEFVEDTAVLEISKDKNGEPFTLRKMQIQIVGTANKSRMNTRVGLSSTVFSSVYDYHFFTGKDSANSPNLFGKIIYGEKNKEDNVTVVKMQRNIDLNRSYAIDGYAVETYMVRKNDFETYRYFKAYFSDASGVFFKGCKYRLLGVRA